MNGHVIRNLPILILHPHNRCNCRCVMCDIWKIRMTRELTFADLERHAADIETLGVRWVVFSGGEPLMHSDLFRLSDFLRWRGIRTTLLSTGLLLAEYASATARSLDDAIISLDGPPQVHDRIRRVDGAFARLSSGIRALHAVSTDFPVAARMTVQRANCSLLRATAREARALGLVSISFLAADVTSEAFNRPNAWPESRRKQVALDEPETDLLEIEIEQLIQELPEFGGFVLESPEKLRRIVRHFRAYLGLASAKAPPCNAPWVSAVVEADGTVRPCFFHNAIGSWKEQSLLDVLNGPTAVEFRKNLDVSQNPICARCVCSLHFKGAPASAQEGRA
jgi:MoaA/NifB/PqqE/SkfB family radical SAM enzyme